MLLDLHIHTIATPGHASWTPETLVEYAQAHGIGVLAVTDHNTTTQVAATQRAGEAAGVHVIPGLELDSATDARLWHVLLYGIDPAAPGIVALCDAVVERNARDAQAMAAALRVQGHALPSFDALVAAADPAVPPTVAALGRTLVVDGVVAAQPGLDDESNGTGWIMTNLRSLYRPVPVQEAIAVAHAHGGLALLAHPGRSKGVYAVPATEADIAEMVGWGLDGIEALYAHHTAAQQTFYSEIARSHGLLVSAGSDGHHPAQGLQPRAAHDCAALLARLGVELTS